MKTVRFSLLAMAAVLFGLGLSPVALAFHDGGVAHCDGCHTMHNSQDGDQITDTPGDFLLRGQDPSSTCLNCHSNYGQFTGGSGYGSGGDYYWLTKTFQWSAHGRAAESTGDSHGHNIIAMGFGLENDDAQLGLTPPGAMGPLPAQLACTSCHDPHGKEGNPLLLYGIGDTRGGKTFISAAPIIESPGRRTASSTPVSDTEHSAFGSGMSDWCANCHNDFVAADKMHPVDQGIGSTLASNYNKYVSTDVIDPTNGPNSYWEHVPFETNEAQDALDINRTAGPTSDSRVMCLSCHRAHASAFPDIGRWYFPATFIVEESHPLITDTNATQQDVDNKYYGKVWTDEQRSLCNKCHIND